MASGRRLWRWAQAGAALLVIGLAIRSLVGNWQEFQAGRLDVQLDVVLLMTSLAVVLAMYAVLIEAWRRVLRHLGQKTSFLSATRIWLLASLGKYLPGKVWAVAGAAVLARQHGLDPAAAVTAALILQALAVASGFLVVMVTAPVVWAGIGRAATIGGLLLAVAALLGVAILAWPAGVRWIQARLPVNWPRLGPVPGSVLALGFVMNLIAWVGYGLAFVCLTRGLLPEVRLPLGTAVGVFAGSYLIGLLAVFAPGGLGPRESLFVLLL